MFMTIDDAKENLPDIVLKEMPEKELKKFCEDIDAKMLGFKERINRILFGKDENKDNAQ